MSASGELPPLVSVLMITYNHEAFIRQAVQSILDQERSFPIEIVISDDGSSDATRSIVKQLEGEHPGLVRDVSSGKRLGIGSNFHHAYAHCRGEFIAMLDSDDYWLSRDKLAKQIALLQSDPGCVLCYHNAIMLMEKTGAARVKLAGPVEDIADGAFFLKRNPITTMTAVFRKILRAEELQALIGLTFQDLPLWVLLAERGTLKCMPELFGVYRVHGGSTYSRMGATQALLARRTSLAAIRPFVSAKTGAAMDRRLVQMHLELVLRRALLTREFGLALEEWRGARRHARHIGMGPLTFGAQFLQAIRLALRVVFEKAGGLVGASPSSL
ncbi:MAG: glycosyltransferase [Proteobacteria bacterium]|nr:glycosyltransferase [Pseudomonadota bacterium]